MSSGTALSAGTLEAQLVANAGDAFIVADADGVIRFWNPAAETMFGYSGDEAIGQKLDIIVPEPQRKAHWDGYFRSMASGETKYGGKTLSVPQDVVRTGDARGRHPSLRSLHRGAHP